MTKTIRCPECGHIVKSYFDHIDIDCEHDMTPEEIAELMKKATLASRQSVLPET